MKLIKQKMMLGLLFFTIVTFSQKQQKNPYKNEIGIDFLELFQSNKIELSYNYLYTNHNSIGTTLTFFKINKQYLDNNLNQEKLGIDFNYRHYFSEKQHQGFYVEGFLKYGWYRSERTVANQLEIKDYHNIDFGVGVGYKYVSKENYFIDVNIRWNEVFYDTLDNTGFIVPKNKETSFSVAVGKRF